jgi:hypothetical protein
MITTDGQALRPVEFLSSHKAFVEYASKHLRCPSSESSGIPCPRLGTLAEASAIDNLFGVDKRSGHFNFGIRPSSSLHFRSSFPCNNLLSLHSMLRLEGVKLTMPVQYHLLLIRGEIMWRGGCRSCAIRGGRSRLRRWIGLRDRCFFGLVGIKG